MTEDNLTQIVVYLTIRSMKPWEHNWEITASLAPTGQGEAHIVRKKGSGEEKFLLKELKASSQTSPIARIRMYREAVNLKLLKATSAKVPKIVEDNTEYFEDLNVPLFLVMEFVQGQLLSDTLKERGKLGLEESVNLVLDLCATMRIVADEQQIVHRDLKPENLMVRNLDPADIVMLDFGLSYQKGQGENPTETGDTMGNKFLILPELRVGHGDKRHLTSDLTSLCGILFFCLTGIAPGVLDDGTKGAPHRCHQEKLKADIKEGTKLAFLNSFLDKGLTTQFDDRFKSLEEFEKRLRQILTPPGKAPFEDPESIRLRQANALRKIHKPSRMAEYKKRAEFLYPLLNERLNVHNARYENSGFLIFSNSLIRLHNVADLTGNVKDIFCYRINIRLQATASQRTPSCVAQYNTVEVGNECIIYRKIFLNYGNVDVDVEPATPIYHYLCQKKPEVQVLLADMDQTIVNCIDQLTEALTKGGVE